MQDTLMRRKLGQDLRQLVVGTITNDEFDDAYYEAYECSKDPTVRKLGQFGWSLYSDDRKYRLRGRHAIAAEMRSAAARCVLFLRSGLEYDWPPSPRHRLREFADAFVLMGVAAGAAITIVWALLLFNKVRDVEFMGPIGVAGIVLLACSVWYMKGGTRRSPDTPAWRKWKSNGDFEVWPFLQRADFDSAKRDPRVGILATAKKDDES